MKRFGLVLALAALCSTGLLAQEPAKQVIKFTAKSPVVGDMATRATSQNVDLKIDIDAGEMGGQQSMTQVMDFSDSRTCTVLEEKDGVVTKFKVTYQKVRATMAQGSADAPAAEPTDILEGFNPTGQTFVFTVTDGGLKIEDAEGAEVGGEMGEFLTNVEWPNNRLGAWSMGLSDLTDKREIAMGEVISVPKEKAMAFIPAQSREQLGGDAVVTMELTLKETKTMLGTKVAVFDAKMSVSATPGADQGMAMEVTMEIEGTMSVGIDKMWVYSSKMKGPLKMEGGAPEMGFQLSGGGDLKMDAIVAYTRAKTEVIK